VSPATGTFDPAAVRAAFPGLAREVHGKPLVYLDSAATAQRSQAALDAMDDYHRQFNANVHRGVYETSQEATAAYENTRKVLAGFLGAADSREIVFTRGTTEATNLVARAYLAPRLEPGDEILATTMEHHSNLVPWQMIAAERGAKVRAVKIDPSGDLDLEDYRAKLGEHTKLVTVSHASNVLGTVNPVRELVAEAKSLGVPVFVDGAQSAPHLPVDVQALGADFYAFSGHKIYGPTGSGALYGRLEVLESMVPFLGGGDMIREVRIEESTWAAVPQRFEAGTPNIAALIGLGAAVEWFESLDAAALAAHEQRLLEAAIEAVSGLPGVRIFGDPRQRISVFCFEIDGVNATDIATLLDQQGVAVRSGHHCAQPLMQELGISGCLRVSLGAYNSLADVDALASALQKACRILRG
jgi:cysteine desulfurase/selenocysteine lyase